MVSKHAVRMVIKDDEEQVILYHCGDNNKVSGMNEVGELRFGMEFQPGIEKLLKSYPKFVKLSEIDIEIDDEFKHENIILLAEECLKTGCFEISGMGNIIKSK